MIVLGGVAPCDIGPTSRQLIEGDLPDIRDFEPSHPSRRHALKLLGVRVKVDVPFVFDVCRSGDCHVRTILLRPSS